MIKEDDKLYKPIKDVQGTHPKYLSPSSYKKVELDETIEYHNVECNIKSNWTECDCHTHTCIYSVKK